MANVQTLDESSGRWANCRIARMNLSGALIGPAKELWKTMLATRAFFLDGTGKLGENVA
jgi:hypothetical protein